MKVIEKLLIVLWISVGVGMLSSYLMPAYMDFDQQVTKERYQILNHDSRFKDFNIHSFSLGFGIVMLLGSSVILLKVKKNSDPEP